MIGGICNFSEVWCRSNVVLAADEVDAVSALGGAGDVARSAAISSGWRNSNSVKVSVLVLDAILLTDNDCEKKKKNNSKFKLIVCFF